MPPPDQSPLREAVVETACNRWQTAEAQWLECAPSVPSLAAFFLADVSMRTGDIDRAMINMALSEALVPNSPYVQRLRERATKVQQRRGANPDVGDAASLSHEDLRKAARIAVECHRWPRAVELWSLLLERSGANPEAYRRLGTCYQNLGDYGNSVLYFREANKQSNDAQLAEAIDRSGRLEQRRFDSFLKHIQRFMQHPAFEAAQAAAVSGSTRLGADLHTLSLAIKTPIAGSLAPAATMPRSPTTAIAPQAHLAARPAETRAGVVLREIDLSAFRPKAAAPPPPPLATLAQTAAHPAAPQRATPPPLPAAASQPATAAVPIEPTALHGIHALPRIRPFVRAASLPAMIQPASIQAAPMPPLMPPRPIIVERPQIPASSPSTTETGSLIQRLRSVSSSP